MVVASGGQTVWSASRSVIHLWDAFNGVHLGTIHKDDVAPQNGINPLDPHNSSTDMQGLGGIAQEMIIDTTRVSWGGWEMWEAEWDGFTSLTCWLGFPTLA